MAFEILASLTKVRDCIDTTFTTDSMRTDEFQNILERLIRYYKLEEIAALLGKMLVLHDGNNMEKYKGDVSALIAALNRDAEKVERDPALKQLAISLGLSEFFREDHIMQMHLDLMNATSPRSLTMGEKGWFYNRLLARAEMAKELWSYSGRFLMKQSHVRLESDELGYSMHIVDFTGKGVEFSRVQAIGRLLDETFRELAEITGETAVPRFGYVESGSNWKTDIVAGALSVLAFAQGVQAFYGKIRRRDIEDLSDTANAIDVVVKTYGSINATKLAGNLTEEQSALMEKVLDRKLRKLAGDGLVPDDMKPDEVPLIRLFPKNAKRERKRLSARTVEPRRLGPGKKPEAGEPLDE